MKAHTLIIVCFLAILGLCLLLFRQYTVTHYRFVMNGGRSMLPTYKSGALLKVKIYHSGDKISRGDVVLHKLPDFHYTDPEMRALNYSSEYSSRVVGLPGENIKIINGKISINNEPLPEPYALLDENDQSNINYDVKDYEYYLVRDNRQSDVSPALDSRRLGAFSEDKITGIVSRCVRYCK